jgi:DNA-binding NarL/FixJ family response regulator
MDLNLPGTPGLEATRRIAAAHPEAAVLVLTMVVDDSVLAALRVGPRGRPRSSPSWPTVAATPTSRGSSG